MRFHPEQLELASNQSTALFLINRDNVEHSLDIDALDIHVSVAPQSSAIALVEAAGSGEYHVYCGVPGHEEAGMSGNLAVR